MRALPFPEQTRARAANRPTLWPWAAAALLCVLFAGWLAWRIPQGTLINTDELLTAERSREMLLGRSPWLVRYNFAPSFSKPPLQYWLTALPLSWHMDQETAVRLWPAVYAVLALAATGWLARVADPARPWLAPGAMILLATCPLVLSEAGAARLDIGLTFLVAVAIGAVLRARQTRGARWLAVAVGACFLASLQKNPLALGCWLLLLAADRAVGAGTDPAWRRRELAACGLAALAVTCWPVVQLTVEGMSPADVFGWHEASVLRGQERLGRRGYFEILDRLTTRWAWGVPALLAVAWPLVAWWRGRGEHQTGVGATPGGGSGNSGVPVLAILCLTFLSLATVAGFRSVRYVLPVMPGVCVLLASGLHQVFETDRRWLRVAAAGVTVALIAADLQHAGHIYDDWFRTAPRQQTAAAALGITQRRAGSNLRFLVVHGSGREGGPEEILPGSFYLFYGGLSAPVQEWTVARLQQEKTLPLPPLIGICHRRDLPGLRALFPALRVDGEHGEFVRWAE